MKTKCSISTFVHFIEYYWLTVNGGGTFTFGELLQWVKSTEDSKYLEKLKSESTYIEDNLTKQDWEIDRDILDFSVKHGKNKIKGFAQYLKKNL